MNESNTNREPITCSECGCIIEGEACKSGSLVYCHGCVERLGLVQCDECGEWFDPAVEDMIEYEGQTLCESCRDADGLVQCEDCGKWVDSSDLAEVEGNWRNPSILLCKSCLEDWIEDDRAFYCEDCEIYYQSRAVSHYETAYGTTICDNCRCDNYAFCYNCDGLYTLDDLCWDEYEEEYYCADCYHPRQRLIHDYSYKPSPVFHGTGYDPKFGDPLTIGFELEVDNGDDEQGCAGEIVGAFDEDTLYIKHDSSVSFEIVTHPHTLKAFREELNLEKLCSIPLDWGFSSHEAGTCGLHMHVGRAQLGATLEERRSVISRIALLMYRHWPSLVKFSRRREGDLAHWAHDLKFSFDPHTRYDGQSLDQLVRDYYGKYYIGRYESLNLENRGTIEFRLWRGSLKPRTIDATLQLTHNIVRYAMTHTFEEVAKSTWTDVAKYETCDNLEEYLTARGLELGEQPRDIPYDNEVPSQEAKDYPFRIGDRVRFAKDSTLVHPVMVGATGTVVHILDRASENDPNSLIYDHDEVEYLVHLDFDSINPDQRQHAHVGGGHTPDGLGYYGLASDLTLLDSVHGNDNDTVGGLRVGDRVMMTNRTEAPYGMEGTVRRFRRLGDRYDIAVFFDDLTVGHACDMSEYYGCCNGWWCWPEDITPVGNLFRPGDRVRYHGITGDTVGTVVATDYRIGHIGVDFGPEWEGHDLEGRIDTRTGWWCSPSLLERVA